MSPRPAVLSVLSLMMLPLAAGCSKAAPPTPEAPPAAEARKLFERKCGVCHGLERSTGRRETKGTWERIVKEMQGKNANFISDPEAAEIVDYLAGEHGKD